VAKIGIFTTASSDPIGAAEYYVDMFVNVYGAASATYIPVTETSNNGDDPSVAELARQQTGFFFGGGDQLRILTALRPNGRDTLVLTAVKDMLKAGAVVGGTSAGTACQVFDLTFCPLRCLIYRMKFVQMNFRARL
jgi:cyanophycinase